MTIYQSRTRSRRLPDWVDQSDNWRMTRQRWYPYYSSTPVVTNWSGNTAYSSSLNPRGREVTVDQNHHRLGSFEGLAGDVGGTFYSEKSGTIVEDGSAKHLYGTRLSIPDDKVTCDFYGPFFAINPRQLTIPTWTSDNLAPLGTTAIARCKPTNNVADASVFLGEILREGIPNLLGHTFWKERNSLARSAGSEYLNLEFGWKPLVNDIKRFAFAVQNAHTVLSQYERDAGRVVRRRFEFPVVRTEVTTNMGGTPEGYCDAPTLDAILDTSDPQTGSLIRTDRVYKKTWFSGAFTYHLPTGYKSRRLMAKYAAQAGPLLGLELTPDSLWNLTPWTWALDWFSNAGDVVSNLSDWTTDGLVLKYGYIMQHELRASTYTHAGNVRHKPKTIRPSPVTVWREVKRRQKATPFGFEVAWNSFSPRQMAIAIALGITRS